MVPSGEGRGNGGSGERAEEHQAPVACSSDHVCPGREATVGLSSCRSALLLQVHAPSAGLSSCSSLLFVRSFPVVGLFPTCLFLLHVFTPTASLSSYWLSGRERHTHANQRPSFSRLGCSVRELSPYKTLLSQKSQTQM